MTMNIMDMNMDLPTAQVATSPPLHTMRGIIASSDKSPVIGTMKGAHNDIDHQLDSLFSNFRQTIPIESSCNSIQINGRDRWLLEALDLLRYLHTMNQQYANDFTNDDDRHSRAARKKMVTMQSQIARAYSMLARAERTCPFVAPSLHPPTTPDFGQVLGRSAMATEEENEDEYYLDPLFRQNVNTLLHTIRHYTDTTCTKLQRWLDLHPPISSSDRSPVEDRDLIYDIFLAPADEYDDEIDDGEEPIIHTSDVGMEHEDAVGTDAFLPDNSHSQQRQTLSSHPQSTSRTPTLPLSAPTNKNVAIDPIQFQKQQQELLEEELASMASRLKSTTLAMNATLQSQTKELDSMEQLAQSNLDQVTDATKDVEGRLAKKRGWKTQLATWTLIGTVVGMWILCFMVMRTVPKRTIGKSQLSRRRGGETKSRWSFGAGVWKDYISTGASIFLSPLDDEMILNDGEEQLQKQSRPQSMPQECEILGDGTQICIGDLRDNTERMTFNEAGRGQEVEAARIQRERLMAERRQTQEEEEEAARLEHEKDISERLRLQEEAARIKHDAVMAEHLRLQEEEEKAAMLELLEQERVASELRRIQEEEEEDARLENEIVAAERRRIQDEKEEAARLEQERVLAERKRMEEEAARIEGERIAAERRRMQDEETNAARLEQERVMAERKRIDEEAEEAARFERLEQERVLAEEMRKEQEKEAARLEQERVLVERRRIEEHEMEVARLEQERIAAERMRMEEEETARLEQERVSVERRRIEEEEVEATRLEQERIAADLRQIQEEEEAARLEQQRRRMQEEDNEAARLMEQDRIEEEDAARIDLEEIETATVRLEQQKVDQVDLDRDVTIKADEHGVRGNAANSINAADDAIVFTPADVRIAAARSENAVLAQYISVSPEMIDASDRGGWRPIHEAVRAGNYVGVQMLIDAGCDLTSRTGRTGNGGTALWWAIQRFGEGHSIVQLLRSRGALEAGP